MVAVFAALTAVLGQNLHDILSITFFVRADVVAPVTFGTVPSGELTFTFSHKTK